MSTEETGQSAPSASRCSTGFFVEFFPGCYFAVWKGDPGRTYSIKAAKLYRTKSSAMRAIEKAKEMFPRRDYSQCRIVPANQ